MGQSLGGEEFGGAPDFSNIKGHAYLGTP